jgi:hypothetical protein
LALERSQNLFRPVLTGEDLALTQNLSGDVVERVALHLDEGTAQQLNTVQYQTTGYDDLCRLPGTPPLDIPAGQDIGVELLHPPAERP